MKYTLQKMKNGNMKRYLPRIADEVMAFKLRLKGAVLVEGPKRCGKSTTCMRQAETVIKMQDTETREQNIALAYTPGFDQWRILQCFRCLGCINKT